MQRLTLLTATLAVLAVGSYADRQAMAADPHSATDDVGRTLQIGDGGDWCFLGGKWTSSGESLGAHDRFVGEDVIRPPYRVWVDNAYQISKTEPGNPPSRAFYLAEAYADLTAEFEFNPNYRELGMGGAGLVLRAADAGHYYFVYFPWGGQQMRAKHFWAIVAKVGGDGYIRNIKAVWVPGVTSEVNRWYNVRVEAIGPKISVWVDGRFALSVTDDTYKSGHVGLGGHGWHFYRNVRISGKPVASPPNWSDKTTLQAKAFTVGLASKGMPTGCLAPNGDVLLAGTGFMVRSKDKGRTWSKPEKLHQGIRSLGDYLDTLFTTSDGRLLVMRYRARAEHHKDVPWVSLAESADSGYTWLGGDPWLGYISGEVPKEGWPETPPKLTPYGPMVETEDGTLLRFLLGGVPKDKIGPFTNIQSWGSHACKAYAIRTTDGGHTWSGPIEMDWPKSGNAEQRGEAPGSLDFTEPTGVAIGNKVTVVIRPIYSPMMWQCWSHDSGKTWDAATRTTFPGYAQSMVRTSSGAILVAHRYPHYSINVSYDDGLNWDAGTVIDYAGWAMGRMIEVEPDLVLCVYMTGNDARKGPLLAQLIRVTPNGIYPVPVEIDVAAEQ